MSSASGAPDEPRTGPSLAERLAEVGQRSFAGREAETRAVRFALESADPPFVVLWLHGPPGIGKTALLRKLTAVAETAGAASIELSGETITAEPDAVRRSIYLAALPDRPALLLIDAMERLAPLEDWLRTDFLPTLPRRCVVVIAGRAAPNDRWHTSLDWQGLVQVRRLGGLSRRECLDYLRSRLINGPDAEQLAGESLGHPLTLVLLADAYWRRADAGAGDHRPILLADLPDVVSSLCRPFLPRLPTERHRLALAVLARARASTEALLRSVLDAGEPGVAELFGWLHALPFTAATKAGLVLPVLARKVLSVDFQWRDPERSRLLYTRLRDYYIEVAALGDQERSFAAQGLRDLQEGPHDDPADQVWIRRAGPADRAVVLDLAARWADAEVVATVDAWWEAQRDAFTLAIDPTGQVIGYLALVALPALPPGRSPVPDQLGYPEIVAEDPAVAAVYELLAAEAPLRPGERVLVHRFWGGIDGQQAQGSWLSALREVAIRELLGPAPPACSVIYTERPDVWAGLFTTLRYRPVPEATVTIGGTTAVPFLRDWRTESLRAWLDRASGVSGAEAPLTRAASVLSAAEFGTAVKRALKHYRSPVELARNPLLRSRALAATGPAPDATALRAVLDEAVRAAGDRSARVLAATYLEATLTQEAAAHRLGLPFSTYRRHLAAAITSVTRYLWTREIHG